MPRALRAQAVRHPQARRARRRHARRSTRSRAASSTSSACRRNTLIYKGMLTARQLEADVPGSVGSERWSRRWRWCTSASAPTRSRRGRWRTRTATSRTTARSTRCAATSTGCARARGCSRAICSATTSQKLLPVIREGGSDTATFDNVLELLVMAGRSLPHAILMMIPEPWSGNEEMTRRAEGVLRVPLLADGAVGRSGVDRLHRRHGDRRGARSQRPAAVALLRHQGRPRHHGVRSRRARRPARGRAGQGAAAARAASSSSTPSKGRIVDDEEIKRELAARASVQRVARRASRRHRRSAGGARRAARARDRASSGSRRSATRRRICAS